jgi:uncharacterized protein YbjT (DUF2867 family)
MILLTGASGKTGRAVLRTLAGLEDVCAFVHHEGQGAAARSSGAANVVIGDLRDESKIRSAMRGVRAIYHICPNMSPDETKIGSFVLDAAREYGVEHFVYHSVLHPQVEKMNHHWQKMRVEEMIFESGIPFTILQPAPYMQNLLANWKDIVENGVLHVPYSIYARFGFVDLEDVAEAARIVLTEVGHQNAIYELAGTAPISYVEVAEIFSQVLRRDVYAEQEETGHWRLRAQQAGVTRYALENLVQMFDYYDKWGLAGSPNILTWILKREPTSFASFIERTFSAR